MWKVIIIKFICFIYIISFRIFEENLNKNSIEENEKENLRKSIEKLNVNNPYKKIKLNSNLHHKTKSCSIVELNKLSLDKKESENLDYFSGK